jgi:hypothetical protein
MDNNVDFFNYSTYGSLYGEVFVNILLIFI